MRHEPIPPLFQPSDPKVSPADAPRLGRQARAIYDLLRAKGTVMNYELAKITARYGARLFDLRRAGIQIRTTELRDGSGVVTYRLVEA